MRIDEWRQAERAVEMTHGTAYYTDLGEGPPCVLLHGVGFTAGSHEWLLNAPALTEGNRVLSVDLVGWGRGARLQQPYSFARLVDFVREFQDRLGLGSSAVVGHSMGGWVATLLAYESPQRVDRLALVGSGGAATRPLAMMTEFTPPTLEQARAALAARTQVDDALVDAWAEHGWRGVQDPEALASYRRVMGHMTDPENRRLHNTLRRLPLVQAPTLVLWGREDPVNALELGQQTAELVPDATLVVMDGGHFLPSERPAELNEAVGAFLAAGR